MVDKLDSDIDVEVEQLSDQYGDSFEGEVLGYGVMYSVGADFNCLVPHDWLMEQVDMRGIPEDICPTETLPHHAYKRAIKRMREAWGKERAVTMERKDEHDPSEHKVEIELKEGDGSYVWHVVANVFYEEDESGMDGGEWESTNLGYFIYNSEQEAFKAHRHEEGDTSSPLQVVWEDAKMTGDRYFEEMKTHHTSTDVRAMMWKAINTYTETTIKLRRSVYLFPAGMGKFIEKMSKLYKAINNEFKERGEPMAIRSFEVLNTDEKQDWIQQKVEDTLEDSLNSLLDTAFESLEEGETSEEVVQTVLDNLEESDSTAETYSSLLEAEISVEEILKEKKREIADQEREEMVENVIDQIDV